ncbi:hypothetical protein BH09PLA1_BH09PLA1_02480 [soil metagenome]
MTTLELLQSNLVSRVVLCCVLGTVAAMLKSNVELVNVFVTALSVYLLLAIRLNRMERSFFQRVDCPLAPDLNYQPAEYAFLTFFVGRRRCNT